MTSKAPTALSPFPGFGPKALDFLRALDFHQDKAWFEENRALYESDLHGPMGALVLALAATFAESGLPLAGSPKTSLFRLHRDTRFSKDKRPYKTNAGAVMSRDGTKKSPGLLYVHVDPKGCFTAAGFYMPEPEALLALRRRLAGRPDAVWAMIATLGRSGLAIAEMESLKRLPKGFEGVEDPQIGALVRLKSLIVRRDIPPDLLGGPDLVPFLARFAAEARPLLDFGWDALDGAP